MRIAYITHTRFPTEKAHGKQIAEVCTSLAGLGHTVTLVCPRVRNTILTSPHDYYDVPENFEVRYLHHFDGSAQWWIPGVLRFAVTMFFYRRSLRNFLAAHEYDVLYVRSVQLLSLLTKLSVPVVAELHTIPQRKRSAVVRALNACAKVVCLTSPMAKELQELGVEQDRLLVEGDGVLLQRFADREAPGEVRSRLQVPDGKRLIGYAGSFVTRNTIEKGVRELIGAIALLKERGEPVFGVIVGGPLDWKLRYIQHARSLNLTDDDIVFLDRMQPREVPSLLSACDVLVYPAPATDHPYFLRDTSPLKLFEYLATGKPIVCADIPPVRDAVDEQSVIFAQPGQPSSFADGISAALQETDAQRTQKRKDLAQWYSWRSRMRRILTAVR